MRAKAYRGFLVAGLLCGVMDLTAAVTLYGLLRGRRPIQVLQSIASGLFGADSYDGGAVTAAIGVLSHFTVAFGAAATYFAASRKFLTLVTHPIICGILYGAAVYLFMNAIVVPLSAYPHQVGYSLNGLTVHILCVGLPIALSISRYALQRRDTALLRPNQRV